jgi:transposase
VCPVTVLPSPPGPETDTSLPARDERMAMPAEPVDVVVGVDTHKHTHTAAVVSASTGGVLDEVVAAPEPLRARFRGRSTRTMVTTAARLRVDHRWDVESRTTAESLRSLARRCATSMPRPHGSSRRSPTSCAPGGRTCSASSASARSWRPCVVRVVASRTGPVRGCLRRPRRCCAGARFVGHDGPSPSQPLRRPTAQPRPACRRALPSALRPRHPRLRRAPSCRGKTDREIKRCLKRYVARQLYRLLEEGARSTP